MTTYLDKEYMWDILSTRSDVDFKEYRRTHSKTWITQTRKILLMRDMDTAHIISCINMLERAGQTKTKAYKGLIAELTKRGQNENKI